MSDHVVNDHLLVKEIAWVHEVHPSDVGTWLKKGWQDMRRGAAVSMAYASIFSVVGLIITIGFYFLGLEYLILPSISGFVFVAPALAVGYYDISKKLARGEQPTLMAALFAWRENALGLAGIGVALVFLFMIWIRLSFTVFALSFPGVMPEWSEIFARAMTIEGVHFALGISALGSVFCVVIFFAAAISLPMMYERNTVLLPSMLTSAYAVGKNGPAMILWGAMILLITGIGLSFCLVGLIVTFPWMGHATYHAYRQIVHDD